MSNDGWVSTGFPKTVGLGGVDWSKKWKRGAELRRGRISSRKLSDNLGTLSDMNRNPQALAFFVVNAG
jgi:hypothetical protein